LLSGDLVSFAALSVVLSVTPGPDTMLVLSNAVGGGSRRGLATTFGVKAGTVTHSLLASVGVAAFLLQFASFYSILQTVGAAYLLVLGAFTVFRAFSKRTKAFHADEGAQDKSLFRCFAEGYMSNILNPKVVVFYVAVLPQFVGPGDPVFLTTAKLASIHVGVSFVWLVCVSLFAGFARRWLGRPSVRKTVNAASGLVIAAFGVRLALSRR
jgi:threonine/homoserine/homoserine lactone efflux protein